MGGGNRSTIINSCLFEKQKKQKLSFFRILGKECKYNIYVFLLDNELVFRYAMG